MRRIVVTFENPESESAFIKRYQQYIIYQPNVEGIVCEGDEYYTTDKLTSDAKNYYLATVAEYFHY